LLNISTEEIETRYKKFIEQNFKEKQS